MVEVLVRVGFTLFVVPVAQWIERWPPEPKVRGSSPLGDVSATAWR